jgi:hypothetical protein
MSAPLMDIGDPYDGYNRTLPGAAPRYSSHE